MTDQKKPVYHMLKLPVPRRWLFFSIATLWMFASFRVFLTAWEGILLSGTPLYLFVMVASVGSLIFTRVVFRKVTSRYITRIHSMDNLRPSLFAMFSGKSYLLIAFMITMGIVLNYYKFLPLNLFSMFLGALGLSLFTSALRFLREWRLKLVIQTEF